MSIPRSHHFVPQFYLRQFSPDRRSLAVLHKASGRVFDCAPIRGQCAINNFHGWHPDAEKSLSVLESASAAVIARILANEKLPPSGSDDRDTLNLHVALQALRTQTMASSNDAMAERFVRLMAQGDEAMKDVDFDRFRIGHQYPAALPIRIALETYPSLGSLDGCLLRAGVGCNFVTSDNPIVLYNSALSDVWWQGVTGLDSEGLQIFFPISTKFCVYLFDPKIYKSASNTYLRILSEEDLNKILALITLNSNKAIYAEQIDHLIRITAIRDLNRDFEGYERLAFTETEEMKTSDGTSSLIANYRLHPPARFTFRFSKVRCGADPRNTRSDRTVAERQARTFSSGTVSRAAVSTSTVSKAREMINDNAMRRLLAA